MAIQDTNIFRIDTFTVPEKARNALLARIAMTQPILRAETGFVRDFIVERQSNASQTCIVTCVEWRHDVDLAAIGARVRKKQLSDGFDRALFLQDSGITFDSWTYHSLLL